jgi:uncharacterized protein involved in exopolysaccharide biosynthesis
MNETHKEFDFKELLQLFWKERKNILITLCIFFFLGIIIAFGSKKEYKSECNFLFDDNSGGSRVSGLLSQFGSLAGINLNATQGIISPEVIPKIVQSTPFLLEISNSKIKIEKYDTIISVYQYLSEFDKPSFMQSIAKFPSLIFGLINKNKKIIDTTLDNQEIIQLSKEQEKIIKSLNEKIEVILDDKTGLIYLRVFFPDRVAVAELNKLIYNKLMDYIIKYKVDKAKMDYNFIYDRYLESKREYEKVQAELANFRDKNKNITSEYIKTQETQLENEYTLAFNVYNGLAQQLEQSKIQVQEAMPVFRMVDNPTVPLKAYKPQKILILILSLLLGLFISITIIIFQMFYQQLKNIITTGKEKNSLEEE